MYKIIAYVNTLYGLLSATAALWDGGGGYPHLYEMDHTVVINREALLDILTFSENLPNGGYFEQS